MRVNMSKFLWSYLLISPAVLGATLVVSSSAMAADAQQAADALKPTATKAETAETAETSEAKVNALAAVSETTAASEPVEEISQASAGNETQAAIADSGTAATESAIAGANTAPAAANPEATSQPTSESLAAAGPTVAQPVENSAQAAQLENPAPAATALPEQIGAVQLETPAPAVAESAAQSLPKPAESVAQTAAPQDQNPAATLEQLNQYSSEGAASGETEGQVTSVSQLSDVRPTDWAFQALQSLVERYGCIAGYPDGTFRGNRAMTRYEFAAGLNACLDKVNQLIQGSRTRVMREEDLATLQRLQEEFSAELATLRGRVDSVEAQTAELEANQFSTTTKLNGFAWFNLTGAFAGDRVRIEATNGKAAPLDRVAGRDPVTNRPIVQKVDDPEITFSQLVWLTLTSSFTGKDELITQLAVGNGNSPANQYTSTGLFNTFGTPFLEQTSGVNPNEVILLELSYRFPLSNSLQVVVGPRINFYRYFDNNNFNFFVNGASSFTSNNSPLLTATRRGAGALALWDIGRRLKLRFGYLGESTEFLPTSVFNSGSNPSQGLFGGTNTTTVELTFSPSDRANLRSEAGF